MFVLPEILKNQMITYLYKLGENNAKFIQKFPQTLTIWLFGGVYIHDRSGSLNFCELFSGNGLKVRENNF